MQNNCEKSFKFEIRNGEVILTRFVGKEKEVVIPDKIDGKPVQTIDNGVFANCHELTSITLPKWVKILEEGVFDDCSGLRSIVLSDDVDSIDGLLLIINTPTFTEFVVSKENEYFQVIDGVLFSKDGSRLFLCPSGKTGDYVVPSFVKTIESNAFAFCERLCTITLSEQLTSIEQFAFGCNELKEFLVPENNTCFQVMDGILFSGDGTKLICCPQGKTGTCVVPQTVKEISHGAFSDCCGLTSVILPDGLQLIDGWAFSNCTGLTSINLPDTLHTIGERAFEYCSKLASVKFSNQLESINDFAFSDCTALTALVLPEGLTSLGDGVFWGCNSLTSIVFPYSLESIGFVLFCNSSKLTSVTFPNGVPAIQDDLLAEDPKLKKSGHN